MFIFLDEAGTFQIPPATRKNLVSCVAAVVIPESLARTLFKRFRATVRPWKQDAAEIKGSKLYETQAAAVIKALSRFDIIAVVSCIDMGLHSTADIEQHKQGQARAIRESEEEWMATAQRHYLHELSARVQSLSNQLYVQSVVLSELASTLLTTATAYYAQRIPSTLSAFKWRLDAKGTSLTNYERLWLDIVLPLLQTKLLRSPMVMLKGANYRWFEPFFDYDAPADHPVVRLSLPSQRPFIDIKKVVTGDLRFANSESYTGLQIADIVATTIRRACNDKLQQAGWGELGKLIPKPPSAAHSLQFLSLRGADQEKIQAPYGDVVRRYDRDAKPMFVGSGSRNRR